MYHNLWENCCDDTVIKYLNLKTYGFINIHIYAGGIFEWLCHKTYMVLNSSQQQQ